MSLSSAVTDQQFFPASSVIAIPSCFLFLATPTVLLLGNENVIETPDTVYNVRPTPSTICKLLLLSSPHQVNTRRSHQQASQTRGNHRQHKNRKPTRSYHSWCGRFLAWKANEATVLRSSGRRGLRRLCWSLERLSSHT